MRPFPRRPVAAVVGATFVLASAGLAADLPPVGAAAASHLSDQDLHGRTGPGGGCRGPGFCISAPAPGPVLYPGATPSPFALRITNPLRIPITVTTLTVTVTAASPSGPKGFPVGCPGSLLTIGSGAPVAFRPAAAAGGFVVTLHPDVLIAPGQSVAVAPANTLALVDNHQNEDSCQRLRLSFALAGQAEYTVPTTTELVIRTEGLGQARQLVLVATVRPEVGRADRGSQPAGSVTFYRCVAVACRSAVSVAPPVPLPASARAIATVSVPEVGTTDPYYAVYTPTAPTDFTSSTSGVEVVSVPSTPPQHGQGHQGRNRR